MGNTDTSGFGKFVPGFDFLQNLTKGATTNIPQMPNLGNWVAPTLNVEELEKRIDELKAVHFWLEQNSRALSATIQALEVQKMTLATLKGMNFNIGDMANALKLKAADSMFSGVQRATEKATPPPQVAAQAAAEVKETAKKPAASKAAKPAAAAPGLVDPLQLWGSLTQQFQQIAAGAMKEATAKTAFDLGKAMATGMAKDVLKSATTTGKKVAAKRGGASKAPAKRAGTR